MHRMFINLFLLVNFYAPSLLLAVLEIVGIGNNTTVMGAK